MSIYLAVHTFAEGQGAYVAAVFSNEEDALEYVEWEQRQETDCKCCQWGVVPFDSEDT
jgi:hypothetical protein